MLSRSGPRLPDKPAASLRRRRRRGQQAQADPSHLEAEKARTAPDACGECGELPWTSSTSSSRAPRRQRNTSAGASFVATCRCRGVASARRCALPPTGAPRSPASGSLWLVYQSSGCSRRSDRIRRDLASAESDRDEHAGDPSSSALPTCCRASTVYWKQLLAGSWMATDGTGLKVIIKTSAAHWRGALPQPTSRSFSTGRQRRRGCRREAQTLPGHPHRRCRASLQRRLRFRPRARGRVQRPRPSQVP